MTSLGILLSLSTVNILHWMYWKDNGLPSLALVRLFNQHLLVKLLLLNLVWSQIWLDCVSPCKLQHSLRTPLRPILNLNFDKYTFGTKIFKLHTPTEYGTSVYHMSVCMFASDPFLIGSEKSYDKIIQADYQYNQVLLNWDYPVTWKPYPEVAVDPTMSTSMTTGLQKCSLV